MNASFFDDNDEQHTNNLKRWYEYCAQTAQLQKKLDASIEALREGVDWTLKDQEELSELLQTRTEIAQKFGLLLMLFIKQNRELPSLIEDHRPEQLSLFAHQAMDGSLHWLRGKTNMIAPPKVLEMEEELKKGLVSLEESLRDLSNWFINSSDHQQLLFEHIVARLRYIQEECPGDYDRRIRSIFHRITDYSKKHTPGFIHGLSLGHKPKNERWLDDAQESWKRIMVTIRQSPEKDALAEMIPLLSEPVDIVALEEVLLKYQEYWSVANTLRLLLPFEPHLRTRPVLKELVDLLHRYQENLSKDAYAT